MQLINVILLVVPNTMVAMRKLRQYEQRPINVFFLWKQRAHFVIFMQFILFFLF